MKKNSNLKFKKIEKKLKLSNETQLHSETEKTKKEILERIIDLAESDWFVEDNYTEVTIHKLFEDSVEFAMDELDENGIDYIEEEIRDYFEDRIQTEW